MRKTFAAVAMVVAVLAGVAAPSGAATTGSQRFILNGQNDSGFMFAAGVVSGVGDVQSIDEDNDIFVFPDGTFKVHHPETSNDESFNEVACVGTSNFAGTFTISNGTGAYAGISGSGTYTGRAIFFTTRTEEGCSEDEADGNFVFFVNATGTASLP